MQSSMLVSHVRPVKPTTQVQENDAIPSWHVPELRQGSPMQSLMLVSHVEPVNPLIQMQEKESTPS